MRNEYDKMHKFSQYNIFMRFRKDEETINEAIT